MLNQRSLTRLEGVHEDLKKVVTRASEITEVEFVVTEGLRTKARQAKLFAAGASQTMNSRHLTGHAVDLAALVGGAVRWDWPLYYKLAEAMKDASIELGVPLVWGGVWDKSLSSLGNPEEEVANYVIRRKEIGKKAFIDGPHWQLSADAYP